MLIVLYTSMQYYYHSTWVDAFVDFSIKLCHESILTHFFLIGAQIKALATMYIPGPEITVGHWPFSD